MNRVLNESGAVLATVLVLLSLMIIGFSGVIIYAAWHRVRSKDFVNRIKAIYLAEAGINRAIAELSRDPQIRAYRHPQAIDSSNSYVYSIAPWGGYLLVESAGIAGSKEQRLGAIVGILPPAIFEHAIILIGPPYPLIVAGRAAVRGDVLASPAGVTIGEYRGQKRLEERAVDGGIGVLHAEDIPVFDSQIISEFLDSLERWKETCCNLTDLALDFHSLSAVSGFGGVSYRTRSQIIFEIDDTSRIEAARYYFADRAITVRGRTSLSRVVLLSETSITIAGSASLEDCILVSPKIVLLEKAQFSGQMIASRMIRISDDAAVLEGSFIFLREEADRHESTRRVSFESRQVSEAFVAVEVSPGEDLDPVNANTPAGLAGVKSGSVLKGLIWCEGYFELLGTFRGSAAVNLFYFFDAPTVYLNWLVDGHIVYDEKVKLQVLPMVFTGTPRLELRHIGAGSWE